MGQALAFTKDKNQIATPWHIVEFISDLFQVQDKTVFDPTAGHGAMLEYAGHRLGIELDQKPFDMLCERYPDGDFINASLFDSADWVKEKNPDIVFMNPPFNCENTKGLEFVRFTASLLTHGYLAAIVPTGAIQDGKKAITATKEQLLEHNTLKAVMKLNGELFYPSAAVAVVLIILEIGTPHHGETWFANFENDGLTKDRKKGRLDTDGKWQGIKTNWLSIYKEKPTNETKADMPDGYIPCALKPITATENWFPTNNIPSDPAMFRVTLEDVYKTTREYMEWKLNDLGAEAFLRDSPHLLPPKHIQVRRLEKEISALQARQTELQTTLDKLQSGEIENMDITDYYRNLCIRFPGREPKQ